ncbi:hypothetical protein VTL71DRAFT_12904, partial [Oculimacula yallundae]
MQSTTTSTGHEHRRSVQTDSNVCGHPRAYLQGHFLDTSNLEAEKYVSGLREKRECINNSNLACSLEQYHLCIPRTYKSTKRGFQYYKAAATRGQSINF